jgi:predicted  nucleic acid-binding Zn-ribbon protein
MGNSTEKQEVNSDTNSNVTSVTKDDIMELHPQIHFLKERQESLRKVISSAMVELEKMDDVIVGLEVIYKDLKNKVK